MLTDNKTVIKNAYLVQNSGEKILRDVLIVAGKIARIEESIDSEGCRVTNAKGNFLFPGFIDVHIQGAGGYDVLDSIDEAIPAIAKTLAVCGTTSFLSTTVVKPTVNNGHIKLANKYIGAELDGANLLGWHLEGPYIHPEKKGGLDINSIYTYQQGGIDEIMEICGGGLKMMTIAPEMEGNLEAIKELVKNKAVASFAHSTATYEETLCGIDSGITHVTHLFNAMNPLHHRNPGPIAAIFERKLPSQIITDGHHLNPRMINLAKENLGSENCVCITDGVQALGLPEGSYVYNGKDYISKEGAAKYTDGTLIGSTTPLNVMVKKFKEWTNSTLSEAINTASLNPAKVLRIDHQKGKIEIGYDADLIITDNELNVLHTFVGGRKVH
ncbi:MAG TPA: N-acetylglucosamine-6-phosphate deacetylase [Ignavibacteriaceae bacterium]|jgi:N-acetylglucosamine-6-phosphate deacetylase|nr:N-acetylglucosamine-6-phosphate deacetylase [Ignavibacteriaceae bacterium]HOJ17370.1 N-acetylglucosamine-6-phosphate deacetylase [Ignavibacteriaceae bacterium]